MVKIVLMGVVATTMSLGMVATSQAKAHHFSRAERSMAESRAPVSSDFQALAPAERASNGQDPLNYNLGYFRNF